MPTPTEHIAQIFIQLDGQDLDPQKYMPLVMNVEVDDSLYLPDMFTITMRDPGLEVLQADILKPGTKVKISIKAMTQPGEPSSQKVVLMEGEITALEPDLNPDSRTVITARGYDNSHKMHRVRQTETYLNVSDSDLARKLAQRSGLQADVTSTTPVYPFIMQVNQTDWEFLMERARRIGFRLYVEANKLYFKPPPPSPPEVELEWGISLSHFKPRLTTVDQVNEVLVRGWDPQAKREIVGRAASPSSNLAIGKDNGATGGARAQSAHSMQGKQTVLGQPVYSQAEADKMAQAELDRLSTSFKQAEGIAGGNPNLQAGTAVNIKAVGPRFGGKYLVTRALHRYRYEGYSTQFWVSGGEDTLSGLLNMNGHSPGHGRAQAAGGKPTIGGVVVGVVTNNKDPDNMGRVKVKFPTFGDNIESHWCRMAVPMAGSSRGMAYFPEANDEVVVAFLNGDPNHGYVIGAVWNGQDLVPESSGSPGPLTDGSKTMRRLIRTRDGHEIVLVDTPASPQAIMIIDKTNNNFIKINTTEKKMDVQCQGNITITSSESGNITVNAKNGNVIIKSDTANVQVQATQNIELKATTKVTINGTAGVDIQSSGLVNIKGSMVNIN